MKTCLCAYRIVKPFTDTTENVIMVEFIVVGSGSLVRYIGRSLTDPSMGQGRISIHRVGHLPLRKRLSNLGAYSFHDLSHMMIVLDWISTPSNAHASATCEPLSLYQMKM